MRGPVCAPLIVAKTTTITATTITLTTTTTVKPQQFTLSTPEAGSATKTVPRLVKLVSGEWDRVQTLAFSRLARLDDPFQPGAA